MKLKLLDSLEEGELFFAYADTSDGKDLRSYFKGKPDENNITRLVCPCTTGDKWHTKYFNVHEKVWA